MCFHVDYLWLDRLWVSYEETCVNCGWPVGEQQTSICAPSSQYAIPTYTQNEKRHCQQTWQSLCGEGITKMYFIFPCKLVILYLGLVKKIWNCRRCVKNYSAPGITSLCSCIWQYFFFWSKTLTRARENLYEVRNVVSLWNIIILLTVRHRHLDTSTFIVWES